MENIKNKSSLHELSDKYLETLIDLENELRTPEQIAEMMKDIEGKWEDKFQKLIYVSEELDVSCEALDKKIRAYEKRYATRCKNVASIKEYMKSQMEFVGKTKVETELNTVTLRASEKTEVEDNEFIAYAADNNLGQFLKVKVDPDKTAIKEHIKAGNELNLPFVKIVENLNLNIR